MNTNDLCRHFDLSPHPLEGGYFKRIFESNHHLPTPSGERPAATAIHYLLSQDSPIGYMHKNVSDILHFHHSGDPIRYYLVSAEGQYQTVVLGPDITQNHVPFLCVPGNTWKASELISGDYGLISEVVCPGFEYADNIQADKTWLTSLPPQSHATLCHLVK